jgi:hypothetical protein
MTKRHALTNLFQQRVVTRSQTGPTLALAILLFVCRVHSLPAQSPPRGDSIGGGAIISTNAGSPAVAQTNANFASLVHTNAAGEYAIGFAMLSSYPMQLPDNLISNTNQAWADAQVNAMIPPSIKALDGKKVRIDGFMLPTAWDKTGKVSDFLLMGNQVSCCYGGPSQVHEFITIHVQGKGVNSNLESTIPVGGTLHVGAVRENGQLVGIYRLETQSFYVPSSY